MRLRKQTTQWTRAALAGALLLPAAGALANETHVYGIASFGGAGQCDADSHPVHTKTAQAFADYFTSLKSGGQWTDVRALANASVRTDLWTDAAKGTAVNAKDTQLNAGVDDADVLFVHTHGGHDAASARSFLVMGTDEDSCLAMTDVHMRLGNGKLDIAVVKACQSGNMEVWEQGGYKELVTHGSGFTVWNAFHGDSSCGNFVRRYLDDYAANSKNDGVGENWLDEAYDWGVFKDDCPVSIVFGKTQADRKAMYATGGWRDRKSTGEKTGSSYFFVKGCDPENGRELYPTAVDTPQQRVLAATTLSTGFTFDATAIAAPPTGGLPAVLITRAAFEDAAVHHALLGTREPFRLTGGLASRRDHESLTWKLERDPYSGSLLALRKTESGPATPQEPSLLQQGTLSRLQAWGIPTAEVGPVRQAQGLVRNEENGAVGAPEVVNHKTFVLRALHGIRVEGHRAVVSHGVDGAFQRALIKWPPLARQGHLLRTLLTPAEIEQRATEALLREGETAGPVRLFWKYVPTQLSTGEVTLTLKVGAAMPSFTGASSTEEPRVVDVDVSPVP